MSIIERFFFDCLAVYLAFYISFLVVDVGNYIEEKFIRKERKDDLK